MDKDYKKHKKYEKYNKIMMDTAILWSQESSATRLKVGAVLSRNGRILVTGYNGTVSGTDNKCEIECPNCNGSNDECSRCQGKGEITSDFVLHAEQNVISYAAKAGIKTKGATMYITHAPCKQCAKLIVASGIKVVVFDKKYRDDEGLDFLTLCGVNVDKR